MSFRQQLQRSTDMNTMETVILFAELGSVILLLIASFFIMKKIFRAKAKRNKNKLTEKKKKNTPTKLKPHNRHTTNNGTPNYDDIEEETEPQFITEVSTAHVTTNTENGELRDNTELVDNIHPIIHTQSSTSNNVPIYHNVGIETEPQSTNRVSVINVNNNYENGTFSDNRELGDTTGHLYEGLHSKPTEKKTIYTHLDSSNLITRLSVGYDHHEIQNGASTFVADADYVNVQQKNSNSDTKGGTFTLDVE